MKLLNDFYQIVALDVTEEGITATVKMNADHNIYHAHFPGNPITPGVCLVQMSTEILEMGLKKRLKLQNAVKIKFRKPMEPSVKPTFIIRNINISEHQVCVQITIEGSDTQYAKMNLLFSTT